MPKRTLQDFWGGEIKVAPLQKKDASAPAPTVIPPREKSRYARTPDGTLVDATKVTQPQPLYICECPEKHKLKFVRPSGDVTKRPFRNYFAHIARGWEGVCLPYAESQTHRDAKYKLREFMLAEGGGVSFATEVCMDCGDDMSAAEFLGADYFVQLEQFSTDRKWRYDCVLMHKNDCRMVYALEVAHTHFCSGDKIESGRGLPIAEFIAKDVLRVDGRGVVRLENLLASCTRRCESCSQRRLEAAVMGALERERSGWAQLEQAQADEMERIDSAKRRRQCRQTELAALVKTMPTQYSLQERGMQLVRTCGDCMRVDSPQWGLVQLCRRQESEACSGFCVGYNGQRSSFAPRLFLLVIRREWQQNGCEQIHRAIRLVWSKHGIPRHCVIAVVADIIVSRAESLKQCFLSDDTLDFKDCLFAVLMTAENEQRVCAVCGVRGHRAEACKWRFCVRCGRVGHVFGECYARSDVGGRRV